MKKLTLMALALCLWWGCKKDLAALSFFSVTMEKAETVDIGLYKVAGRVDDLNQESVEQCGFVWSMDEDSIQQFPDALERIVLAPPAGNGTFSTPFSVLPGQIWYIRAFAIQGARKVYSKNIRVLNLGAIVEMTGNAVVSNNHAMVQGLLTGIDSLTQTVATYGHVYSATNHAPALGAPDCDTTLFLNGNADGVFTSHLTGLNFNTTYHVRAYATDGNQVFYSERVDTFRIRDGWEQIPDFPAYFADGAAVMAANGYAYAGFGINNYNGPASDILKDFWQFDPVSTAWTNVKDFSEDPDIKRTNTSVFAIGDTVYMIFGHHNVPNTNMVRNFWKYSISIDSWGAEVPIPISQNIMGNRSGAAGFVLNGKIYVGAGHKYQNNNLVYLNDFWEYDPQTGSWRKVKSLPMKTINGIKQYGRYEAVGFANETKGFVGGGEFFGVPTTDFWRFTPPTGIQDSGQWDLVTDPFPGIGRIEPLSFTVGNKAYYGCGYNLDILGLTDFYEFDMTTEKWSKKTPFQGGNRFSMIGFGLGANGYGGCGIELKSTNNGQGTEKIIHRDFWRYVPEIP